jgi:hypothetical protein
MRIGKKDRYECVIFFFKSPCFLWHFPMITWKELLASSQLFWTHFTSNQFAIQHSQCSTWRLVPFHVLWWSYGAYCTGFHWDNWYIATDRAKRFKLSAGSSFFFSARCLMLLARVNSVEDHFILRCVEKVIVTIQHENQV